jgi:restriction system protein
MIPTYEEILLPFLRHLKDGSEHSLSETHDALAQEFSLSEEEVRELLPSGQQAVFRNRIGWARTYLKKAGLVVSTKRAHFKITEKGKELLNQKPRELNAKFLTRYEEFVDFLNLKKSKRSEPKDGDMIELDSEQTPEESLEYAYQKIKNNLAKELIDIVKSCSPRFFERLVIDLLISMGYGGSRKDAGEAVGKSGDGGIDGIIKEDRLGLDIIYLQAKKWENPVPVKEIRDFTGALASKKAKKGIFISTSTFPQSVYEFVSQVEYKIILIDGKRLAELMIENNIGLSIVNTYHVKTIDTDYFEEV